MKKKNILTPKEARVICDRLKKQAKPSKALKKYVHEELLKDAHIMYQYKVLYTLQKGLST